MAKVTIDGKEYDSETLSDEAKNHIQNVQYCEQKMADLQRELAVVRTARNAYAQALQRALPKNA
jgi:ABC-type antimicrobial peptide transport system ATPase subunit